MASAGEYDKYKDIRQGQQNGNYRYDSIGNLISDASEGISNIDWTVYGKISSITKDDGSTINYSYDASGNRISKAVTPPEGPANSIWYVRDASGNLMAVYEVSGSDSLYQSEQHLYGSSRLGIYNRGINADAIPPQGMNANLIGKYFVSYFTRGNKNYELSNHLGNVLVTLSDKKFGMSTNGSTIDYYTADVVSANDYYPFGMMMPGRTFSGGAGSYRFGFNGKENDNDISPGGQDYGMRIYDKRLGRFLSTDPITGEYPELTPYQFASNTPIAAYDIDGLEAAGMYFPPGVSSKDRDAAIKAYNQSLSGFVGGFAGSAWSTLKSTVALTSTVPTPESLQAKGAMIHAITHPKETLKNIQAGFKQWTNALKSSDPYSRSHALGQGLEFGAEFLIPIPLAKGAAGTRVAGRTVGEILDVSKGIGMRGLLEDYALSTKSYKGFENANITIVANNPVFDLINKAGDVVDVTSTAAKTLNANQFTKKLDRLGGLSNVNSRTLQIYVKEGQYTAEQLGSLGQKLTDHISTNQLQKTSFAITPIK